MREGGAWLGRSTHGPGTRMPGTGKAMNSVASRKGLSCEAVISRIRRASFHGDGTTGGCRDHRFGGRDLFSAVDGRQNRGGHNQMC